MMQSAPVGVRLAGMKTLEHIAPGNFCWAELATSDQAGAKSFYGQLFGWAAEDHPMGPGEFYTTFQLQGRDVGAAYTLRPDMVKQGVPPHWALYVAVESADRTAAEVAGLGGKLLAPPFDVFEAGRMAVLQDPAGANIALWQGNKHAGFGIAEVPGCFCWADLMTGDAARAEKFYSRLFGWKFDRGEKGGDYLHIRNGEAYIGGVPPAGAAGPGVPPHWAIYYYVSDCAAATGKAKSLGGRVYVPPTTMEGVGCWSVVADPQGATFMPFQPMERR